MGRAPCCDKANVKKGPWSPEEDIKLKDFIEKYGTGGNWIALPHKAGLKRCGKSCRLRWLNYLRPNLKHGEFSQEEDAIICSLFATIGSRWSIIASQLPGRTDNDIKNYWNTKLKKKLRGITSPPPPPQSTKKLPHQQQQQPQQEEEKHDQNLLQHQQQDCFPSPILSPPPSTPSLIFQDHILKSISSSDPVLQYSNLLPHDHTSSTTSMMAFCTDIDQISCSSSYDIERTSTRTAYSCGKDLGIDEFAAAAMEEENRLFLGGGVHQLESNHELEYSYEEIKQLLNSDSINSKANTAGEIRDDAESEPQHYRGE